jgi:hypothetical protein
LIGCTLRWAEKIVEGTAKNPGKRKAPQEESECEVTSQTPQLRTNREYFDDITGYAEKKLQPLLAGDEWNRYGNICKLVERFFAEAKNLNHVDDLNRSSRTRWTGGLEQ